MKKELYNLPGKVVGHFHPEINTIVDTWTSMFVSLEQWKSTVYDIGITDFAPKNGVTAWIIDTSKARSVFPPEVQEFRQNVAKLKLEENGVEYLFVVLPEKGIGKFSAGKTANLYEGQGRLKAFEVKNIDEALLILKEANVKQRAAS